MKRRSPHGFRFLFQVFLSVFYTNFGFAERRLHLDNAGKYIPGFPFRSHLLNKFKVRAKMKK